MRAHQLAHFFAEPELPQVSLAEDIVAGCADVGSIRGNHLGHVLGGGDEAADVVQEGCEDDLAVVAELAALLGEVGAL
jgi:hypothetical protein